VGSWDPPKDWVRLFIPPAAFLAWTAFIGTSALSPWVGGVDHRGVVVVAITAGIVLLAVNRAVAPDAG
jgi:hypothetical protein